MNHHRYHTFSILLAALAFDRPSTGCVWRSVFWLQLLFLPCLLSLLLCSCDGNPPNSAASETCANPKSSHSLSLPQPPVVLSDDSSRLDYVASHYWDRFDFSDTIWVADTAALEQAFVDYLSLLRMLPAGRAAEAQRALIDSVARCIPILARFTELQEHYLYNPNSPLRSEELYIPVLEAVTALQRQQLKRFRTMLNYF